jgi:oligoendopeptidase F
MPRSRTAARKVAIKRSAKPGAGRFGNLPEWNLADLYSGLDDPAIKRDLDKTDADCAAFETAYKGKLADIAGAPQGGAVLAEAVRAYEAIDDLTGRLG